MSVYVESGDVTRFRSFIERRFGFALDDAKLTTLAELLRKHVAASGRPCKAYLDRLETSAGIEEQRALAIDLTIPETYFFRGGDQLKAFREVVLPERIAARATSRCLRVLSAGCASGEEPYSLAILVFDAGLDASWNVQITGADLNTAMLAKARSGLYTSWSLRETPEAMRERWFRQEGALLRVDERVRRAVTFEERNLTRAGDAPWPDGTFDVVFWRNVMMYFTPAHAAAVLARLTRALAPGGYLFLGHAETLRGMTTELHLCHTHETFYYQRKDLEGSPPRPFALPMRPVTEPARTPTPVNVEPHEHGPEPAWPQAIGLASDRIRALSASSASPVTAPDDASAVAAERALESALALFARERFAEALAVVEALSADVRALAQVALLQAALLLQNGRFADAEKVCAALLASDELDAGAHYLLGLCREGIGDRSGATDHHQIAAYLDPTFAMPRLHLGLLARRGGDRSAARRELGLALVLLQSEEPRRVLLFGGGFTREALATLCRHELAASGGGA